MATLFHLDHDKHSEGWGVRLPLTELMFAGSDGAKIERAWLATELFEAGGYVKRLAIIGGRARHHRRFLLALGDNGGALGLTLFACLLAIKGLCSQSKRFAHVWRHWGVNQHRGGTPAETEAKALRELEYSCNG